MEHLAIQLLWVTVRLLVKRLSPTYLVDEIFIFVAGVTQGNEDADESKILPCCFHVWCNSRELGGRGSSRFPCVTPVVESFFSDLLQAIISY